MEDAEDVGDACENEKLEINKISNHEHSHVFLVTYRG